MLLLDYVIHSLKASTKLLTIWIKRRSLTFSKVISSLFRAMLLVLATCALVVLMFRAEDIHRRFLRNYVGSRVYQVLIPDDGGGTGFAVKAPSGQTYVLTNDHICTLAKNSTIVLKDGIFVIPTVIIARSTRTDLCLLRAPQGIMALEGLNLSTERPELGDPVVAVGHPALDLLTVSNKGEIISIISTKLADGAIKTLPRVHKAADCDIANPKFHVERVNGQIFCVIDIPSAYSTSVLVKQGNSGSPLVNFYGDVVGVISGMDRYSWGIAITLDEVRGFLADK